MPRPASSGSSGPPSPVSSSSTGSLTLTPASTIEEKQKVRILALLKARDLEGSPEIEEIRELLRKENKVVCLQLVWQKRSVERETDSFLRWVFALPALKKIKTKESLKVTDLRIVYRSGAEWRRRSAASNTTPPSLVEIRKLLGTRTLECQSLDRVPWGEKYFPENGQMYPWSVWEAKMGTELQLVLHHDYLVLAEIPAQPVTRKPAELENNEMQCLLCGVILSCEKEFEEPCLFHPGQKLYNEQSVKHETDEEDSMTSNQSVDDDIDDQCSTTSNLSDYIYLCCKRKAYDSGCVVEATHLSSLEVNDWRNWRPGWKEE
ncbi:hypothetical protein AC578_5806 [Pseudocercospora eumusae]|uniref:Uncharacterized protein n=1 Tax=Pseudocercospora eumusae TaxID=321146 RepID=A0A139HCA2_9PEZI|nr:hypothetical protein AC578_5806 [Pseudocercospora eumusae]